MAAKEVKFQTDARERCCVVVDVLANAVKVTLGRRAVMSSSTSRSGAPRITKDGVSVAKEIELEDKFENMGAQMLPKSHPRPTTLPGTERRLQPCSHRQSSGKVPRPSPPA